LKAMCIREVKKSNADLHLLYDSTEIQSVSRVDENTFRVKGVTWIRTSPSHAKGFEFERCYSFIGNGDSLDKWFFDRPMTEKLIGYK
jgi:hypothetical protein